MGVERSSWCQVTQIFFASLVLVSILKAGARTGSRRFFQVTASTYPQRPRLMNFPLDLTNFANLPEFSQSFHQTGDVNLDAEARFCYLPTGDHGLQERDTSQITL